MKNNFPFGLFNQELLEASSEQLEKEKAKVSKHNEIAEKMLPFLDGMTLNEVDEALCILRCKCQACAVVKNEN